MNDHFHADPISSTALSTDQGARSPNFLPLLTFGICTTYATVRYNVIKGVAWGEWPSYTLNKSFALTSLALIVLAVVQIARKDTGAIRQIMMAAGGLALAHILLSLALLSPAYYAKFFDGQKLTAIASIAIMLGAASAVMLHLGQRESSNWGKVRRSLALTATAFLVSVHAAFPGFSGWFKPSTWPGGLPPITLISFVLGLTAIAVHFSRTHRSNRKA